jgi:hypothetical protein
MLVALLGFALQNSWTRTLPNSVILRLVGVVDIPTKKAWDPTGKPISFNAPPFLIADSGVKTTENELSMILYIKGAPTQPSLVFTEDGRKSLGFGETLFQRPGASDTQQYEATGNFSFLKNRTTCNLTIACATGKWKTVGTVNNRAGTSSGLIFAPKTEIVTDYVPKNTTQYEIQITIPKSLRDGKTNYKLVAYGTDGKQMDDAGSMTRQGDKGPFQFEFRSSHKPLGRIELQARPYTFVTFKSVALKPKG